jgi:hypothetical protein
MMREHYIGLGIGFCIAAAAINVGSPVFFTNQHVEFWRQNLVSSGLLSGTISEQEANARGSHNNVSQWGY